MRFILQRVPRLELISVALLPNRDVRRVVEIPLSLVGLRVFIGHHVLQLVLARIV